MISMAWRTGVASTMKYFDEHLSVGDYYLDEKQSVRPAQWVGEGAARLGLHGDVQREDFEAVANNLNPSSAQAKQLLELRLVEAKLQAKLEKLEEKRKEAVLDQADRETIRATNKRLRECRKLMTKLEKSSRLTARMNKAENRRTFWDVAVSPPKDVSVLAALDDEETREAIKSLHARSAKVAAEEMQRYLGVRERANGNDHTRVGGVEAVIATVEHDTARPVGGIPDPHLHTHLLIGNAVYDRKNQRWSAMSNEGAVGAQFYLRQVYYNEMVQGLEAMGYKCETREMQKDFVLSGMNRDLVDAFSRRHKQVKERASKKMQQGMWDKNHAEDLSVLEGREAKVHLTDEQLESGWHKVAGAPLVKGFNEWQKKSQQAKITRTDGLEHLGKFEAASHAKKHVFTNQSVAKQHEVLSDMLQRGRGNMTLDEAKGLLNQDSDFLQGGEDMVTTREVIVQERRMIQTAKHGQGAYDILAKEDYQTPHSPPGETWEYSEEQLQAIEGVLSSRDLVTAVNGVAGAGKTTLLAEIERGVATGGRGVVPLAPSGQAVGVLRKEGFEKAETLQQWLVNQKLREETRGSLLVVDEAGMVGTPAMNDLLQKAKHNDCRILLVGDTKQIQSVERGDAFRLLQERSGMRTLKIEESRRQKTAEYKDSVTKIRHAVDKKQWASAWEAFDAMGVITQIDENDLTKREATMIDKVAESYEGNNQQLIVAARWSTIHEINNSIRKRMIKKGDLGEHSQRRAMFEPVHLSPAEKARSASYEVGQKISFIQVVKGFGEKGETLTVKKRSPKGLVLENADGREILFHQRKHAKQIQVYNERELDFRRGDRILIKSNQEGLKNGQLVDLESFDKDGGLIVRDAHGGKHTLAKDYKHALHGYAVTCHSSQGATVDDVLVVGDGMSKEQFYVAATRGRHGIEVLTTDRMRMEMQVAVSGERKAGIEMMDAETVKKEMERKTVLRALNRPRNQDQHSLIDRYAKRLRHGASKAKQAIASHLPSWLKNHEAAKHSQSPKLDHEQNIHRARTGKGISAK